VKKKTARVAIKKPDDNTARRQPFQLSLRSVVIASIVAGGIPLVSTLVYILGFNGAYGFPLDDPWIHLTFARNLVEFGAYSYFKDIVVTSGSTSPLYTFILALGWLFFRQEFLLSYAIGALFFAAAGVYFFHLARIMFDKEDVLAIIATAMFVLIPRVDAAALSGMETSLFVFMLIATMYYYAARRRWAFAVFAGLLVWTRPDGWIMLFALVLNELYRWYVVKPERGGRRESFLFARDMVSPGTVFLSLIMAYTVFNQVLSGSFFPNTLAAKAKYYSAGASSSYWLQVLSFYLGSPMTIIGLGFLASLVFVVVEWIRKKAVEALPSLLFIMGMILGYWVMIPFLYQDGRYLIPTLPFFVLCGVWGWRMALEALADAIPARPVRSIANGALVMLLAVAVVMEAVNWQPQRKKYYWTCRYITDRQVKTARWISANLSPGSVIATHDIGAIGFYSGRRVVDMVGLVSPQVIPMIGNLPALDNFLREQGVTHLAVLRNWFEVVNQRPLYTTNQLYPEIMEVFRFLPGKTHIMSQQASRMNGEAAYLMKLGRYREAFTILRESFKMDPQSSKTVLMIGIAQLAEGDTTRAIQAFQQALKLQPDNVTALASLGMIYSSKKRHWEALRLLKRAVEIVPNDQTYQKTYYDAWSRYRVDSLNAIGWVTEKRSVTFR